MGVQRNKRSYARPTVIQLSGGQRKAERVARFEADQRLHLAVQDAIEDITNAIEKIAEEHNKSFDEISSLVNLGGHVLKQRWAPMIQNALSYCWAQMKGRCCKSAQSCIFFTRSILI